MEKASFNLTEKFIMLSRLFIQKHHQMGANQPHDPFRGQGRILALLKTQPEMSQKQLSHLLGIRPQSLGELLTKLEQSGYITRTPSAEDRRALEIRLTTEGAAAALANEQRRAQELVADEMFQCLNKEEQEKLAGYMDRLIDALQEALGCESMDFSEHRLHSPCRENQHRGFDGRRGDRF